MLVLHTMMTIGGITLGWYWWSVILGLIAAPFLNYQEVKAGFVERGALGGFGAWLGSAIITIPILFVGMAVHQFLF